MKNHPEPDLLEEARKLLDLGKVQDALLLAMNLLCRELDQLREALQAIHVNLPPSLDETAAASRVEAPPSEFCWPEPPSRLLH